MKKILQIAKYDFKRLMFNPITLVGLIIVLGICFVTGLVYKIPTSTAFSASVNGQTTKSVYQNFMSSSSTSFDSRAKLDGVIEQSQAYLDIQMDSNCFEFSDLADILNEINDRNIENELQKFRSFGTGKYIEENDVTELKTTFGHLKEYVTNFQAFKAFETRLIFTNKQFEELENITNFLYDTVYSSESIASILTKLSNHIQYFEQLQTLRNINLLTIDTNILVDLQEKYISKAETKLSKIRNEMTVLYNEATTDLYTKNLPQLKSLITNYKAVAYSTKNAILGELNILLNKVSGGGKHYNYENLYIEDFKNSVAEAKFYLDRDDLYYKQYQTALNFGRGSYKITVFDHSYFIMSIVGFLTILFGIFCAYKLFGRDRRNGKLDLLLSQKVKFSEVFAGKFLAIMFSTLFVLGSFTALTFVWGSILYTFLPNSIFAVFNLQTAYTISPFLFLLIKILGIELQAIFWSVFTILLMNLSRKFEIFYVVGSLIFILSVIGNIFLNTQLWYCLLPFVHIDLTSFIGGATMTTGFLVTSLYTYGNFFISLAYYLVVLTLVYNFTNQLFKKT